MEILKTDVLVIGSGIAGLATALEASEYGEVLVISKGHFDYCNSTLAQGGIAAAVGKNDSPRAHTQDTLVAGAGICSETAVEVLTQEAPFVINDLIQLGTAFDRTEDGEIALGREGAHSLNRIVHRGDNTGAAIWDALYDHVKRKNVNFMDETIAQELLVKDGCCYGAIVRSRNMVKCVLAKSIVLATGGIGELYGKTTNSLKSTGDGLALAYKAGAELGDLEFVQFHPTAFATDDNPLFLISEAVRGEGAVLVTEENERFMQKYHARADLAPRDVVTRSIVSEVQKGHRVFLEASVLGECFERRFPNIYRKLRSKGLDPMKDLIPITPAAHFFMGGIKTDSFGRTNVKGLYACGECANTGVHGANRLASNSLLEGLVFGRRIAKAIKETISTTLSDSESLNIKTKSSTNLKGNSNLDLEPDFILDRNLDYTLYENQKPLKLADPRVLALQEIMWTKVGIIRNEKGLREAYQKLCQVDKEVKQDEQELSDMILVAKLITTSALQRLESRGGHYREDYPEIDPAWQLKHLSFRRFSA